MRRVLLHEPALTPELSQEMIREIVGPGRIWPPQNTPTKGRLSFATGEHEDEFRSPEVLEAVLAHLEAEAREPGRMVKEVLVDGEWVTV